MKFASIDHRRVRLPFFAATAADDERLWPWNRNTLPDAVLISYDVLRLDKERVKGSLAKTLNFRGLTIVDSGGYGASRETNPVTVYELQKDVKCNLGVLLDKVALTTDSPRMQRAAIAQTIRNARRVRRLNRGVIALEAVAQGASPRQLAACGRQLGALKFDVYGVPVSMQAKYRRYRAALERVVSVMSVLPVDSTIHALGCGSRTLIAILSAVGVTIFDSRSYYQRALYGENLKSVTMCALGQPKNTPECAACLEQRPPGRNLLGRVDRNLHEMQKEILRVRCALGESAMEQYLQRRLSKKIFAEVQPIISAQIARRTRRAANGG
jgi:queuine/archaeosine tRNA-ribosyltransferase